MNILDIISNKRDKKELTKEEIEYFVKGYTSGEIADYQAASLIMAIYLNGMTKQETTNLSFAMAHSGEILNLSSLGKIIVDKHSTGGVGDKVSIILLPLVASLGIPVAKMSGRGLGFTGGTVDKLESIPGYKTQIDIKTFIKNVKDIGISMIAQTLNLAPADKKLYALRDVTSCVESIPLIASSIMSKKIASGADKIVLDVTCGEGAFMKTKEDAKKLAKEMIEIGKLAGKETRCVITKMDEPLGYSVGNTLEVIEAINCLKANMPEDVKQVVLELGNQMMILSKMGTDEEKNKQRLLENIENGKAYNKFLELVKNQGGDISYIEDINKFPKAKYQKKVIANKMGYVNSINALEIGKLACYLGAGRIEKEDNIDHEVGIVLNKKVGNKVEKDDVLAYIYANDKEKLENEIDRIENLDEENRKTKEKIDKITIEMEKLCEEITELRKSNSVILNDKINQELAQLEMKNARFNAKIIEDKEFSPNGKSHVEFVITTNLGEEEKKLNKIASGGEMSRIMLAIKTVLSDIDEVPVLIFDEIDTGISGKAAQSVGEKIKIISQKHQVLCITHQANIAAKGDSNYFISKKVENEKTYTNIKLLNEAEVIEEIARISSGDITKNALEHAREMRLSK